MTDVRGFWVSGRLVWQINGEFISDRGLRQWWHHRESERDPCASFPYVGDCVRRMHTDAYAARNE
jgi:hypothetical protein